jgi:hypothetical protein
MGGDGADRERRALLPAAESVACQKRAEGLIVQVQVQVLTNHTSGAVRVRTDACVYGQPGACGEVAAAGRKRLACFTQGPTPIENLTIFPDDQKNLATVAWARL